MTDEKTARLAAIRAANTGKTILDMRAPSAPGAATAAQAFEEQLTSQALLPLVMILLAAAAGAVVALVAMPPLMPGLSASLRGAEPKAYWFLSRASALVAYGLLWLAMVFGLLMSGRLAPARPGGASTFELHQHASLLGLAFALFHALILMGDAYIHYGLRQVLVPFSSSGFKPLWVGLGQVGIYLLAIITFSFYVRPLIGRQLWRLIHMLSFVLFALALGHGLYSGSDSQQGWVKAIYWASGIVVLFLAIYRILMAATARAADEHREADADRALQAEA